MPLLTANPTPAGSSTDRKGLDEPYQTGRRMDPDLRLRTAAH